jgi:hypothetical protein
MVLVLGSADCVLRWNGISCGLISDQRGQKGRSQHRALQWVTSGANMGWRLFCANQKNLAKLQRVSHAFTKADVE